LGIVLFAALVVPVVASAQSVRHRLFLKVIDAAGRPIPGLKAADFLVVEGGATRDVVHVARANDPMRLVLLVDNAEVMHSSLDDLRKAVQSFVDGIPPEHEIALITIGDTPVVREGPTLDHAKLRNTAQKMFTGGSTILISAVTEMYNRFLKDVEGRWPMFVIITSDGPEDSGRFDPAKFTAMMQEMQMKDVVTHAVVVSTMGRGIEMQVATALTQATGGHYDSIVASNALPQILASLAAGIAAEFARTESEYVLDYVSPSASANPALEVSVNRDAAVTVSRGVRIR
jgi:hypothetical protein